MVNALGGLAFYPGLDGRRIDLDAPPVRLSPGIRPLDA